MLYAANNFCHKFTLYEYNTPTARNHILVRVVAHHLHARASASRTYYKIYIVSLLDDLMQRERSRVAQPSSTIDVAAKSANKLRIEHTHTHTQRACACNYHHRAAHIPKTTNHISTHRLYYTRSCRFRCAYVEQRECACEFACDARATYATDKSASALRETYACKASLLPEPLWCGLSLYICAIAGTFGA